MIDICTYPGCIAPVVKQGNQEVQVWCYDHFGMYPHQCVHSDCIATSYYDDEPWCFYHSPDSGSSLKGYSAYAKDRGLDVPPNKA